MFSLREKEKSLLVLRAPLLHAQNNRVSIVERALADQDIDILKRKQVFLNDQICRPYSSEPGLVEVLLVQNLQNDAIKKLNQLCSMAVSIATANAANAAVLAGGSSESDANQNLLAQQQAAAAQAMASLPDDLDESVTDMGSVIHHCYWSNSGWDAIRDLEFFFPCLGDQGIERTFALIKPGTGSDVESYILNSIWATGLFVISQKKDYLTKEQVDEIFFDGNPDQADSRVYEEMLVYLTSGPSTLMVLEGAGAVNRWRLLCGPNELKSTGTGTSGTGSGGAAGTASTSNQTIRGNFAVSDVRNVVHCSETVEAAKREINATFFAKSASNPGSEVAGSTVATRTFEIERTLCIVKPNAIKHVQAVQTRLKQAGFEIVKQQALELNEVRAEDFLRLSITTSGSGSGDNASVPIGKLQSMVQDLTSGPVVCFVLNRVGAVSVLKQVIGPDSPKQARFLNPNLFLRGLFGENAEKDGFYISQNPKNAGLEVSFLFPELGGSNKLADDQVVDYLCRKTVLAQTVLPEIGGGYSNSKASVLLDETLQQYVNTACLSLLRNRKGSSSEAISYLADYLDEQNPNAPREITDVSNAGEGGLGKMSPGTVVQVGEGTAISGEAFTVLEADASAEQSQPGKSAYKVVEVDIREEEGGVSGVKAEKISKTEFEYPPLVVFVTGAPGSGKRTICGKIAKDYGYNHINLSDLVNAEVKNQTRRGLEIEKMMSDGQQIPNEIILNLLKTAMLETQSDTNRYLLDGFPTTVSNGVQFEQDVAEASLVLNLECSEATSKARQAEKGAASDAVNYEKKLSALTPVIDFYKSTGRLRTVDTESGGSSDATQVYEQEVSKLFLNNFIYIISSQGMCVDKALALSDDLKHNYAVINARDVYQRFVKAQSGNSESGTQGLNPGSLSGSTKGEDAAKIANGLKQNRLDFDASLVCPLILEEIADKSRQGYTDFLFVEFPKTVKQQEFLEYRLKCQSRAIVLDYPAKEILSLGARIGNSQIATENDAKILAGSEIQQLIQNLKTNTSYIQMAGVSTLGTSESLDELYLETYKKLKEELRPSCVLVLGPPGCHQKAFSEKWAKMKYAGQGGSNYAISIDLEELLERELQRNTDVGATIHNMTAVGQVIPLREITINKLLKGLYRFGCEKLLIESFPSGIDEVQTIREEFKIDEVFSMIPADVGARRYWQQQYLEKKLQSIQSTGGSIDTVNVSDYELIFSEQLESLVALHNDFSASATERVWPLMVDNDCTVEKTLEMANEAMRDRYILFTGLPNSGSESCVLDNLVLKYPQLVVPVTSDILLSFAIEQGLMLAEATIVDLASLPGNDLAELIGEFFSATKLNGTQTIPGTGKTVTLAKNSVFALVNIPFHSEQYQSLVNFFGQPKSAYYFKTNSSEVCVQRTMEINAAKEEPAELDAEVLTAEYEEKLPILNGIVDLANSSGSAASGGDGTTSDSVYTILDGTLPPSDHFEITCESFKVCCFLILSPEGRNLGKAVANHLSNKVDDTMTIDLKELLLNADKVLTSESSKRQFAAELLCIRRANINSSSSSSSVAGSASANNPYSTIYPSSALWTELLKSTIESNPQCSSFILINYINPSHCAAGVAAYPTSRDLLDSLESLLEIKKIIYTRFQSPTTGEPLLEDLNRLSEPEDLSTLFSTYEFLQRAYGNDSSGIVHAVSPDGDVDVNTYAMRVIETLDA